MAVQLIKTKKAYHDALKMIDELFDAKPHTKEADDLELLSALVELYEEHTFPIKSPSPLEAIRFRMEQMNLAQKDLIPYIGNKSKVSEVLSGKRPLSLTMIRKLSVGLGIPADVLIQPYEIPA